MFLIMDSKPVNESSDRGVTSLEDLYTDFDGWVARYNSFYKRSKYFSKEISTEAVQNDTRPSADAILEHDVFFGDLLLRHRHPQRSAKPPCLNFYKENDGFVFYDLVFHRLMQKNGDRRLVYQYIRSKL
ncbi:hypothetical protein PYW07_013050 [Mythimna separata]|uniref:Uncharacterized protein n=1 Tax=Mythimna separata TaxID=271217 RepID=A0AAD7Y5K4_MYTSE|nr:hypothetical protein PYW07_013050 [Mythimna separata]